LPSDCQVIAYEQVACFSQGISLSISSVDLIGNFLLRYVSMYALDEHVNSSYG